MPSDIESADIVRRLAALTPAELGTARGEGLHLAAKKWLTDYGDPGIPEGPEPPPKRVRREVSGRTAKHKR